MKKIVPCFVSEDKDLWFPDNSQQEQKARKICKSCPETQKCLDYAVVNDIREGIWGGLSPKQRTRYSKLIGEMGRRRPRNSSQGYLIDLEIKKSRKESEPALKHGVIRL